MKKFSQNKFLQIISFLKNTGLGFALGAFLVLGIFVYTMYSSAAWTNPTAAPTNNNVTAPIFVGTTTVITQQTKFGTFKLGTTTAPSSVSNLFVYNGVVSIATTSFNTALLAIDNLTGTAINSGGGYVTGVENPFGGADAVNKAWADSRYTLASANFWADRGSNNISNTNTGNVGIGTITPNDRLEVVSAMTKSSGGPGWNIVSRDSTSMAAGVGGGIIFQGYKTGTTLIGNLGAIAAIKENATAGDENGSLLLYSSNAGAITERVRINSSGNVGIGTITPGAKLDIPRSGNNVARISNLSLGYSGGGYDEVGYNVAFTGTSDTYTYRVTDTAASIRLGYNLDTQGGGIEFRTAPSGTGGNALTLSTKMYVSNSGNVGIGTASPLSKLHIQGAGSGIRVDAVGASDAVNLLTFSEDTNNEFYFESGFSGAGAAGNYLKLQTFWGNNAMTWQGTGNVGIGTTNPGTLLQVSGGVISHPESSIYTFSTTETRYFKLYDVNTSDTDRFLKFKMVASNNSEYSIFVEVYIPTYYRWTPVTYNPTDVRIKVIGQGLRSQGATFKRFHIVSTGNGVFQLWLEADGANARNITLQNYPGGEYLSLLSSQTSAPAGIVKSYDISANGEVVNGDDTMFMDGNVGIGTISLTDPLTINGNIGFTNITGPAERGIHAIMANSDYWAVRGMPNSSDDGWLEISTGDNGNEPIVVRQYTGGSPWGGGTIARTAYILDASGNTSFPGQVSAGPGDLAEEFSTDLDYPAGTVLVMDDKGFKSSRASQKEYDPTVIGVVSEKPGLVIGKIEADHKAPVVLNGVTRVNINKTAGKIHKGDMLATSAIKGEAMKAADPKLGTIIGKALEDDAGKGWIMALVNLK